ncbi:extensin-like [Diprion similis]|uniref:extensin-like n=1 Tax=Diprion similis TaxID=362088 RepID=UPI001EF83C4D|nr:extensin-like [Diprion similis]
MAAGAAGVRGNPVPTPITHQNPPDPDTFPLDPQPEECWNCVGQGTSTRTAHSRACTGSAFPAGERAEPAAASAHVPASATVSAPAPAPVPIPELMRLPEPAVDTFTALFGERPTARAPAAHNPPPVPTPNYVPVPYRVPYPVTVPQPYPVYVPVPPATPRPQPPLLFTEDHPLVIALTRLLSQHLPPSQ